MIAISPALKASLFLLSGNPLQGHNMHLRKEPPTIFPAHSRGSSRERTSGHMSVVLNLAWAFSGVVTFP